MPDVDLVTTTQDVLARLLRRLPPSLWDTDPTSHTVQRDLAAAIAQQCALWIEQREIARRMSLLLEAEGADLDTLLADYGLRRYLQRPDAYARQVGMQILWTPRATQYAVAIMADLLLDQTHVVLRTGRHHLHVFMASSQPVTAPYTYWGLLSDDGRWYAVTVDAEVAVCALAPPCGVNEAPGIRKLNWFTVLDDVNALWYVTVQADTLHLTQTVPTWGQGTTEPFSVLDGTGTRWHLQVDSRGEVLIPVPLSTAPPPYSTWIMRAQDGTLWYLSIQGEVPAFTLTAPPGSTDQTPVIPALDTLEVPDETGTSQFLILQDDTLVAVPTPTGGVSTANEVLLGDASGQLWQIRAESHGPVAVTVPRPAPTADVVVLSPSNPYETLQLVDSAGVAWWLSISGGVQRLTASQPATATDRTPPGGPYRWLRVYDLAGNLWYAAPDTSGTLVVTLGHPGGLGTLEPTTLGDVGGVRWHYGVTSGGTFAVSSAPPVDYQGRATAINVHSTTGERWFWRVDGGELQWSRTLWPDTIDQSPWGDLGWLRMQNDLSQTVYAFSAVNGTPVAALAPPAESPWGWAQPILLYDRTGQAWHLTVTATPTGVGYWRLRLAGGPLAYLSIDGEVPLIAPNPPAGGTDHTPGGQALDWFSAYHTSGQPAYVVAQDDTLILSVTQPLGLGTGVPFQEWGTTDMFWALVADQTGEVLVTTTTPTPNVVGVATDPASAIPAPAPLLPLADADDAFAHVKAAGSVVTVLVK